MPLRLLARIHGLPAPIRRTLVIVLLAGTLAAGEAWFADRAAKGAVPAVFVFSLPLPADMARTTGLDRSPAIISVTLAGTFSDWNPDDTAFRLAPDHPTAGPRWSLRLPLPPGTHQYKFVLRVAGRSEPAWVHDAANPQHVPDAFGGSNSIHATPDDTLTRLLFRVLVGGTLAVLLLLLAADGIGRLVFRLGLKREWRVAAVFIALLALANTGAALWNMADRQALALRSALDQVGLVHAWLASQGLEFQRLAEPVHRARAADLLAGGFSALRARTGTHAGAGPRAAVSELVLFDARQEAVGWFMRRENTKLLGELVAAAGAGTAGFWRSTVFGPLFARHAADRARGAAIPAVHHARVTGDWTADGTPELRRRMGDLGWRLVLAPVTRGTDVMAWFGAVVQPAAWTAVVDRGLLGNLVATLLVIACAVAWQLARPRPAEVDEAGFAAFCTTYRVSKRERELVTLLVQGLANLEIAERLFISPATVKVHVANIYRKCRVKNRVGLVSRIRERR